MSRAYKIDGRKGRRKKELCLSRDLELELEVQTYINEVKRVEILFAVYFKPREFK